MDGEWITYDKDREQQMNKHLQSGIAKILGWNIHSDEITIICNDGYSIVFWHAQDCCETVELIDSEALLNNIDVFTNAKWAKIETITTTNKVADEHQYDDDCQYTFIKFKTNLGYDTWRWLGCSNGYYSIDVDYNIIPPDIDNED